MVSKVFTSLSLSLLLLTPPLQSFSFNALLAALNPQTMYYQEDPNEPFVESGINDSSFRWHYIHRLRDALEKGHIIPQRYLHQAQRAFDTIQKEGKNVGIQFETTPGNFDGYTPSTPRESKRAAQENLETIRTQNEALCAEKAYPVKIVLGSTLLITAFVAWFSAQTAQNENQSSQPQQTRPQQKKLDPKKCINQPH